MLLFLPPSERIAGLTTKTYDKAKKMETPARNSVGTDDPARSILKSDSSVLVPNSHFE